MITQREAVFKNSYQILSRRRINANKEELKVLITKPKAHWFSRQKKEVVTIVKPIKGGTKWRDQVYLTGGHSYDILDDLLMWMVVYYPMISGAFDFESDMSSAEAADIVDNSTEPTLEPVIEREPVHSDPEPISHESSQHHEIGDHYTSHDSYRHHDIGDSHVSHSSHDSYDSGSYDGGGGGGGDCGGSCGGCD